MVSRDKLSCTLFQMIKDKNMKVNDTTSTLEHLPEPKPNQIGWPWTEQTHSAFEQTPEFSKWPRISVVTPSYNQCEFLEATIRSVLLQNYPNLEYIVIDGGSTDGSLEIIKKYERYLAYWISEKDKGQSHAINKGFAIASGDILCWINSDDMLKPGSLHFVAQEIRETDENKWLVGSSELIDDSGHHLRIRSPKDIKYENMFVWSMNWFPQQSTFWTRYMWESAGPLDEDLHFAMDFALWLSMFNYASPTVTDRVLSSYRRYEDCKSIQGAYKCWREQFSVSLQYIKSAPDNKSLRLALGIEALRRANRLISLKEYYKGWQFWIFSLRLYPQLLKDRDRIVEILVLLNSSLILFPLSAMGGYGKYIFRQVRHVLSLGQLEQ